MPIKDKSKYPLWWECFSYWMRFKRAGGRCECKGECGTDHKATHDEKRCFEQHGTKAQHFKGNVILTVAHLHHNPQHWDVKDMKKTCRAMCQKCHLRYDRHHHQENSRRTRERKRGQPPLLEVS